MSLYLWKLITVPNAQQHNVIAENIETAIATVTSDTDRAQPPRVISAIRGDVIDAVAPVSQKGHPYR